MEVSVRSSRAIPGSFLFSVSFAVMQLSAFATGSVTLAWNASTDPNVAGYNVYYGGACGAYTNKICAGNATNATISGLTQGTTYYFAATTYAASGMESPYSSEVSCLVPLNVPTVNYSNTYTAVVCYKPFPVHDKHAAIWEKNRQATPTGLHELWFSPAFGFITPHRGCGHFNPARTC